MLWTIIVNDPPYGNEKPWNAFRLASTAISQGINVRLFLMGDSVASAKTGQKTPDGFYNMEKMLSALLNKGAEVKACGTCINARGLDISERARMALVLRKMGRLACRLPQRIKRSY